MLETLKKLNNGIEVLSIHDREFKKYGRVLEIDTDEIVSAGEKLQRPQEGSSYELSVPEFETLGCSNEIREHTFGGCKVQIGICHGRNSLMNGLEYHKSSEVNIAITPLVLILGLEYEMEGDKFDASRAKAFYLKKGDAVEVYSTSMHFCPCQVSDEGFSAVVALPEGTNDILEGAVKDKLLFKKNKWIICHEKNQGLIERGVFPGIYGENHTIKY